MKAPFKTPAYAVETTHGNYALCAADAELICALESPTQQEVEYIVHAINTCQALWESTKHVQGPRRVK